MELVLSGFLCPGRSTTFEALTRQIGEAAPRGRPLAVCACRNERVDRLSRMFEPQRRFMPRWNIF